MKRALLAAALGGLMLAGVAGAQTFPVVPGSLEIQGGIGMVLMPEEEKGFVSAQPELRVGYFFAEGVMLQAMGDTRVWPLGTVGSSSYGVTGNILWFPNFADRSLYFLGGAGGTLQDPPGEEGSSFDTLLRGGLGMKASLAGIGAGWLAASHFTMEYRTDIVMKDETNIVSGIALGLSWFR